MSIALVVSHGQTNVSTLIWPHIQIHMKIQKEMYQKTLRVSCISGMSLSPNIGKIYGLNNIAGD